MPSSDASTTPPALTPDITGSGSGGSTSSPSGTGPTSADKKPVTPSRRQVAFYPNMNSSNKPVKPFSRSAAKRQSVMTLGSIEHLQHYFTKTGLAAKTNPSNKLQSQFVPAIGGLSSLKTESESTSELDSVQEFELPPSPVIPTLRPPAFPPFVKTYETNPEAFLPGVVDDLVAVTRVWGIETSPHSHNASSSSSPSPSPSPLPSPAPSSSSPLDILNLLKTTTHAIRSVRNYVIALPDESAGTLRTQYRNKIAAGDPVRRTPRSKQADPLSMIRKSALEVLSALRELEELARVPLADEAYDAQSDHGSSQGHAPHSRVASPSAGASDDDIDSQPYDADMSISFIRVQGRYDSIPVWEDENDHDGNQVSEEERDKRERWDDKLILGGGWLYKQDVRLEDLSKEREVVEKYVGLVDDVLFGGRKDGKRGWEKTRERLAKRDRESRSKSRRVSAGDVESFRFPSERSRPARRVVSSEILGSMGGLSLSEEPAEMDALSEEETVDEDDLPEWAQRTSFAEDTVGRAHALLYALLPEDLRSTLPAPSQKSAFLHALSSGQLLCVAYNTAVRRSRKPWGFISIDSIHDIISLEQSTGDSDEKGKTGWTFRRSDNLRLWA
ncbi:hypothetical protein ID866_8921, partial [Astraeus odoratus]